MTIRTSSAPRSVCAARRRTLVPAVLISLCVLPAPGGAQEEGGDRPVSAQVEDPRPVQVSPPRLSLRREDVDLENCVVHYGISRRAVRGRIEVWGLRGELMHSQEVDFGGARPGARLEVTWPPQTGQIGRIEVTTWDENEANVMFRISPFRVEIPHADVVFETGKWEIRDGEKPKLDEAWALIARAMEEYGTLLEANLYVAGFTDTVGQPHDNQTLSDQRALAIARYFEAKGMTFPIYARGFGEQCLAQPTEDSVDCEANRRAAYVLAVDQPIMCPEGGSGSWRRVR